MAQLAQKLDKILEILTTFDRRIYQIQERLEHVEQMCTSIGAYVRKNGKRAEEAMVCCHDAFKMCCNAQYNLSEDLDCFAGTMGALSDRVKIV